MTPPPNFERDGDHWLMPAIPARDNCGLGNPFVAPDGIATDMIIPDHLRLSDGTLAPGALAVLADSTIGFAIVTSLDRPMAMATSHLHIEIVRPTIGPDTGRLRCNGRLVHDDGNHYALGQGTIVDDDGRLIALATVGAVLMAFRTIRPPDEARGDETRSDDTDPARAISEPITRWATIEDFLRLAPAEPGTTTATFSASPAMANTSGGLHGGIGVLMGERTLHLARDPASSPGFALVELRASYPRPIAVDDGAIACRATVTHRGRKLMTIRGELLDQRGRLAVVVDGTYIAIVEDDDR